MAGERIVVVEDEQGVRDLAVDVLSQEYEVEAASSAGQAWALIERSRPDLVLLDLTLEKRLDGLDICRALRANRTFAHIGVIVLTAEPQESTESMLLDAGADDYIRKSQFSPKLLESRVRAVLRRTRQPGQIIMHGPLKIHPGRRAVEVGGDQISLTPTEFTILFKLASNADRALQRRELLESYGGAQEGAERAVDVHVYTMRKKMGRHSSLIETVQGVGYRLAEADVTSGS